MRVLVQDDDYLIVPEVLHTLHAAITQSAVPRTIHLLPAHEHLSTSLRELHVSTSPQSTLPAIHTGFAWLGHGAMLHRSEVTDFLALMRALHATEPEMKMADNYYTILGNRVPEAWFDQGIELGGGQPFTVGTEGDERNNRHKECFTVLIGMKATGGVAYIRRESPLVRSTFEAKPLTASTLPRGHPPRAVKGRRRASHLSPVEILRLMSTMGRGAVAGAVLARTRGRARAARAGALMHSVPSGRCALCGAVYVRTRGGRVGIS